MSNEENETFAFQIGDGKIEVWCDGREYDAVDENYRPVYSYKITTPDEEYVDNDIRGAANEQPDNKGAAKSLLAFLFACQEGMPKDTDAKAENARLFPPNIREWAYLNADSIELVYEKLSKGVDV